MTSAGTAAEPLAAKPNLLIIPTDDQRCLRACGAEVEAGEMASALSRLRSRHINLSATAIGEMFPLTVVMEQAS